MKKNLTKMWENNFIVKISNNMINKMQQKASMKDLMKDTKEKKMSNRICNFHIIYIRNIMKRCNRKKCNIKNIMEVIVIEKYGQKKMKKDNQCGVHLV